MPLYLGLDSSTQSLTGLLLDTDTGQLVAEEVVSYGEDLPAYGSPQGFLPSKVPGVVHADPLLWLAALDLLLGRWRDAGAPLHRVAALSGAAQQHGSVSTNGDLGPRLERLEAFGSLPEALAPVLARPTAPIWLDTSTGEDCRALEEAVDGQVRTITGSPATERFTGPQVRKFAREEPAAYARTTRIDLVSSFLASVLCGQPAPLDHADASGMNLLDLGRLAWHPDLLAATAPGLRERLPRLAPARRQAGTLAPYFRRYGLPPGLPVYTWTGDNPSSLAGTGAMGADCRVVSLGTSDTLFGRLERPEGDPEGCGHVFAGPAGGYLSLICFANGSLAREAVKHGQGLSWEWFDGEAFARTPPGNRGNQLLPYFVPEITPRIPVAGVRRTGEPAFVAGRADPATEVRAVVEAQVLALRLHSAWMPGEPDHLRITGGGAVSAGYRQVLADVFQRPVRRLAVGNSSALGAALRAAEADGAGDWDTLTRTFCPTGEESRPVAERQAVYEEALCAYRAWEDSVREEMG
jgi:xylulokinase